MTESSRYYITTPIYYVNGLPHVGSALTTIASDVLSRHQEQKGRPTWLLTGTDENAPKVQEAAGKAGEEVAVFVESLAAAFRGCWDALDIRYDDFIRTTEPRHVRAVQEFVARLQASDYVYLDIYEGWYSVSDETFFRDSEVSDGFAIETGKPVVRVREENYFFKLSAFGDRLLAHMEAHPDFLMPEFRRNEVMGFLNEGLRDMCITRANKGWGIPMPGDPSKVIYVWFDALINYLTATGWPDDPEWVNRWPASVHFVGKEIFVRFHATLWPAMLMALDLPLPDQVYAHGWFTVQGAKGGKTGASLPHPVRLARLIQARSGASEQLSVDALRYVLCREMNFGPDTEFSVENCLRRFNTDLANDLGNLLNRTSNMAGRYFAGHVPAEPKSDPELTALAMQVRKEFEAEMATFRLNAALESAWKLVGRMNKYIDEKAPWTLARLRGDGDTVSGERLEQVIYDCLESVRFVSVLVYPFMPHAAAQLQKQLGIAEPAFGEQELKWGGLEPGSLLGEAVPLFPRIQELTVDPETLAELGSSRPDSVEQPKEETRQSVENTDKGSKAVPGSPVTPPEPAVEQPITIDDFMNVQLKVAEILAAEPVANATKLLRLTVQAGDDDTRTILAGIAEYYAPDQLIGRKIVIVANLQPRKMRGIESQGMLLAADVEGRAVLLAPDSDVPVGSRVR